MRISFETYCTRVKERVNHLKFAAMSDLLNTDGHKVLRGYEYIEFVMGFCHSYESLKIQIGMNTFTKEYGELEAFKPLLRYLNSLPDVKE